MDVYIQVLSMLNTNIIALKRTCALRRPIIDSILIYYVCLVLVTAGDTQSSESNHQCLLVKCMYFKHPARFKYIFIYIDHVQVECTYYT